MENKVAYFAHSKKDYGSKAEKNALKLLGSLGYRAFCPNNNLGETGSMSHYLKIAEWCDVLVAMEHNGKIGRGVYEEVNLFLQKKRPAYVLRDGIILKILSVKIEDSNNWQQYGSIEAE